MRWKADTCRNCDAIEIITIPEGLEVELVLEEGAVLTGKTNGDGKMSDVITNNGALTNGETVTYTVKCSCVL